MHDLELRAKDPWRLMRHTTFYLTVRRACDSIRVTACICQDCSRHGWLRLWPSASQECVHTHTGRTSDPCLSTSLCWKPLCRGPVLMSLCLHRCSEFIHLFILFDFIFIIIDCSCLSSCLCIEFKSTRMKFGFAVTCSCIYLIFFFFAEYLRQESMNVEYHHCLYQ